MIDVVKSMPRGIHKVSESTTMCGLFLDRVSLLSYGLLTVVDVRGSTMRDILNLCYDTGVESSIGDSIYHGCRIVNGCFIIRLVFAIHGLCLILACLS